MKKLLLLGGLRYLIPVIKAAKKLNCHVITCDYLPDSIAHKFSDEYHNISIIDKEAVLELSKKLSIDGIMSFAVDPGVVTAAYVAEKMGLPHGGPYESVTILQNKMLFRQFLNENGFNVPKSRGYSNYIDANNDIEYFNWPVIVKPVDGAGSKGVTKVNEVTMLNNAVEYALKHSVNKQFIVEEFIEQEGCSSDTDCFSVDGELKFVSFSAQRFSKDAPNPYTPAAYSWPSTMTSKQEKELTHELQRLLRLLHMRTSIYNMETRVGKNGKAYIMEVSPRGGGNRLAEVLEYATGVNLVENSVKAALGQEIIGLEQKPYNGHWAEVILHTNKSGIFKSLFIDPKIEKYLIELDLWVKPGDYVEGFQAANNTLGTMILRFDSEKELQKRMDSIDEWTIIKVG